MSETLLENGQAASERESTSMLVMIINFVTGGLGIGILSLPWSAAGGSILLAAIVNAFVMFIMAQTCCIIAEACEKYKTFDLGSLVRRMPGLVGRTAEWLVNFVIWAGMFMCLVGYMIVAADAMLPILAHGPLTNRMPLIVLCTACCLPLCYVGQQHLILSSCLAIVVNIYILALVAYLCLMSPWTGQPACSFGYGKGIVALYSTIMMAVPMQMSTPPMYRTLERRSVVRFRKVVFLSYFILFLLFMGFQTIALYAFGPMVPQDVIVSLPIDAAGNVARFGMLGVILGVYPLMVMPMVAPIKDATWGGQAATNSCIAAIALASMAVSFFVSQLGVLNVIHGAMTVLIGLVTPGLVGVYLVEKGRCAMLLLICMGLVTCLLGFFLPENYVGEIQRGCLWR